ncbi:hypothetical protein G3I60_29365 [Streptomyces sp. SID13666]|uniref:DUF6126 family protein n=1 Tax=Streptomyces TaxID=1883 RepID=UPI001106D745|nr:MULTISPECIES: DUF6126 family protein [Streptomyces]MCZ4100173.1 DUF6126 family protein [Streptomyces sp. H39-C1]NEA58157.1 hypothetical protein [Streptomyces sp. SID13666]NEA73856.1 hypothetical protein [Streptomyces sp. SID13588]QNA70562.1 hypothetical protein C8250_033740 [Streptomyces sp. So13.3]
MNDTAPTEATPSGTDGTGTTPVRAAVTNTATGRPRHEPLAPELRTSEGSERRKERAVVLRVLVYVVVAHLLAGFVWLLFVLGAHGN